MIYTVTFNPSIDYIVTVDPLELGKTNRTSQELMLPGGKGINVSQVLQNLGFENTALGFLAGFVGDELQRLVTEYGINADFVRTEEGISRINVKIKNIDGTEINGMGPEISKEKLEELKNQIRSLKSGDALVFAGSIPQSIPDSIYSDLMAELEGRDILTIVDATKDLLLNVLPYHPFMVKPNNHELGEIFGVELKTREEVVPYAKKLQEKGAVNVLVSMAGEGAVLVDANGDVHMTEAPKGTLVNAVGAGDSMVAGFLAGWLEKHDYAHAFKMGVSAGSASAFSENLATREEVEQVYNTLK